MTYFVGYGDLDTKWHGDPEEGDIVFLIGGRAEHVMVGLFIVGEPGEAVSPVIEAASTYRIRSYAPVPEHLLPDPQKSQGVEDAMKLYPVIDADGRELGKIAQQHVKNLPGRRERQEKGEKPPEQLVKDFFRSAKTRIGQRRFRDTLMRAYDSRCAITECAIDEVLSAAHILDYSGSECQEVWNGILLRADIHLLFDRHLLRIFPGDPSVVMLAPGLQKVEEYKRFHKHPMRKPKEVHPKTNEELRRRWDAAGEIFGRFPEP